MVAQSPLATKNWAGPVKFDPGQVKIIIDYIRKEIFWTFLGDWEKILVRNSATDLMPNVFCQQDSGGSFELHYIYWVGIGIIGTCWLDETCTFYFLGCNSDVITNWMVCFRWETFDSFMQHDVQELCRVVSNRSIELSLYCSTFSWTTLTGIYWAYTVIRDHFVYVLSQWETTLQCDIVSHWLGAPTKWSLCNKCCLIVAEDLLLNNTSTVLPRGF